jgi:hypothetical protein
MRHLLHTLIGFILSVHLLTASEPVQFNTAWIPDKPEMLTYRTSGKQGDGLYQVTVSRMGPTIEVYINIIANGFTKSVSGSMTGEMKPIRSSARIHVNGQISMETECSYQTDELHISTLMKPYDRTMKKDLPFTSQVVDFSQLPLFVRTLILKNGGNYSFTSLDPQTNALVPFSVNVLREETLNGVECFKVEDTSFEGRSVMWVERSGAHRVLKIEQPEAGRVSVLIQ